MSYSRWTLPVLVSLLFVAGSALRVWFAVEIHPPANYVQSDMAVYHVRASHLATWTLGPWDTFTPIGYPAFVAAHYALGWRVEHVGISQALLGGLICSFAALIAARLAGAPRERPWLALLAAVVAGIACVIYVPLIRYGALLLSEVPFAFGVTFSIWSLLRLAERARTGRAILAGTALALATAIRPNLLLLFPLLPFWFWIVFRRDLRQAARVSLIVFAAAAPWLGAVSLHNSKLRGEPTGLATNGGLNFFMARAPVKIVSYHEGRVSHQIGPIPNVLRFKNEFFSPVPFYEEEYFYREGWEAAYRDPSTWWKSIDNLWEGTGLGVQSLWPYWKGKEWILLYSRRLFAALALGPVLIGFVVTAIRGRLFAIEEAPRLLVYLVLATVAVTLYVWLGDPRVRVPFDPLILSLAAALWIDAVRARRER